MTLRLNSITFNHAPQIPGIRQGDLVTIKCHEPANAMKGWRAILRGPALLLISPPGWMPGRPPHDWDPKGACTMHEVARSNCYLHWSGTEVDSEEILKGKFVSPPFGPEAKPPEVIFTAAPVLDPSQIGDP